jgi:hypothetical protein
LILVLLVSETFNSKIQFNGHDYASADEMPSTSGWRTSVPSTRRPRFILVRDWLQN